jgi:glycosyltransferase involved in cell wall biosynthesis
LRNLAGFRFASKRSRADLLINSTNYALNVRILFVHEVNWAIKVTFEMHELPELLSLRGHDVDFLDFPEGVKRFGLRRLIDLRTETTTHESRTFNGSRVRVITPGRVFAPPLDRLFASLTFVPCLFALLRVKKYDIIVLYAVPTNGWQTILLARLFDTPVIYRGLDVSHEIRRTRFSWMVKVAEQFVYQKSTWLSLNNRELLDYCVHTGGRRARCSVDFAGVSGSWRSSESQALKLREQLSIPANKRVIYYLGSLFTFCGLPRVLVELARSTKFRNTVAVVITGDGELMDELIDLVQQLELQDCVHIIGRIRFDQIPSFMAMADVAIIPFDQNLVTHAAFPWKAVQYLAAGLPVVATQLNGLRSVFEEGDGVIYESTQRSLLERVKELLINPEMASAVARRGQDLVQKHFAWERNVMKFEDLIRSVIKLNHLSQ